MEDKSEEARAKREEEAKKKSFTCKECGASYYCEKKPICECKDFSEGLKNLLKEARAFKMETFKEKDKSISEALHIPYSGMGNPDYVHLSDFVKDDACSLIIEFIDNDGNEIKTIEKLKGQIENIDDDSRLHEHVEGALTWQQSLTNSDKIISYFSEYEEDDTGLWEGQQPEQAISSKAFWTYKRAVMGEINNFIDKFED